MQQKYLTIKKEILSIVNYILKFQEDPLNQKFLLQIDCMTAKDSLKNVKNLASKHIFIRWQALLTIFYCEIKYIK